MRDERNIPIIALDGLGLSKATRIVTLLAPYVYGFKVHDWFLQFHRNGIFEIWKVLAKYVKAYPGQHIPRMFMDLKSHDIPNTIVLHAKALDFANFPPPELKGTTAMWTVHATGGVSMMEQAVKNFHGNVMAATVLSSMSPKEVQRVYGVPAEEAVLKFSLMAHEAKVSGVVCSGEEVGFLSKHPDLKKMVFVVTGTRLPGAEADDQSRVVTPAVAIEGGATHLVWGRPITKAINPLKAFEAHMADVRQGLQKLPR
jgi:orotidine-5'-phosphate decarboxylase